MRIFAVDENNDMYIAASGQLAVNTALAALVQTCEHSMQSLLGEMVFSTGRGLPYREAVWSGAPNLRLFELSARRTLRNIEGVVAVDSLTYEARDNTLNYQATIRSSYGTFTISNGSNSGRKAHG